MRIFQLAGICGLAFTASFLPIIQAEAAPAALYTAAQAAAGATVFTQNCAVCHGANLQGDEGPALIGQKFAAAGSGNTIGSIFSLITQQMPLSSPGSLSPTEYENVMSFILSKNGYPAGGIALAAAASTNSTVPLVSTVK